MTYTLRNEEREEVAYFMFGLFGPQLEIEFPTTWHEHKRIWLRISLVLFKFALSWPWRGRLAEDHYQCAGPTYGFNFYEDLLFIYYGNPTGTRRSPMKAIYMPWHWRHHKTAPLTTPLSWSYTYKLNSGEIQQTTAKIYSKETISTRFWIPYKRVSRWLDVEFASEVGERSGSWKGGVLGCSWELLPGESDLNALRRMETERRFE